MSEEIEEIEETKPEKLSMKSLQEQIDNMNKTEEEIEAEVERRVTAAIEAMGDKEFKVKNGRIAGTKILVMTPDEYRVHSAKSGLIMGRKEGEVTKCSIEELRALINSNWTPSMVMEKHGMNVEGLKQLVWKLSKEELREKPIKFNIERDFFGREG